MHIHNKIHVLIITFFFSYVVWCLLCHLQGERFCTLKTIVTVCEYIGFQFLYSYLKENIFQRET
jgi:hypothetical protein